MAQFCLKDSGEYYLALSEQPKRFDADSPVTNVFFDDSNGEVFTVRSGGVTGVTVTGMDETKCTSFRMEDRGPIISIKFSPDHNILAIQRNLDNQNATVEFVNFHALAPTNVEYTHMCKWKNAKILGFVWSRVNEIAFITDHGIELLQVVPEKKQLKSLKNTSFSGAWFSWCSQSKIVLLAGNNGALLQPFSLSSSAITKMQKLELEAARPVVERDVFLLKLCDTTWCCVFRHGTSAAPNAPGPTEVWLMPIAGTACTHTHVLKTGLVGRFAVSVVDDLVVVHHQSSQTSQIFDIQESSPETPTSRPGAPPSDSSRVVHIPIVPGCSMRPAYVDSVPCPMYSVNWVVFQPDYIIDARLGCLWRIQLIPSGLAHSIPKDEISKIVAVLLRRTDGKQTIYQILNQLVSSADVYLVELSQVFDEINTVYRKWAEQEVSRNTAGTECVKVQHFRTLIAPPDMCSYVLHAHADHPYIVQVLTAYIASLSRHDMVVQHPVAELTVRALVTRGAFGRLRSLVRRGCLGDARPLACQLLSLGHLDRAAAQLAKDMMFRLQGREEIVEVLLSWNEPIAAIGAAKQAGGQAWYQLPARKLLQAARSHAETFHDPSTFVTAFHVLQERNLKVRGTPSFLKSEQCDPYIEYYKQVTAE